MSLCGSAVRSRQALPGAPKNADLTMNIRKPLPTDLASLWALGMRTPEIQVNDKHPFMCIEELEAATKSEHGVFLVAENIVHKIVGFIYAELTDAEARDWACLVYLVVASSERRRGAGQKLYDACMTELKARGVHRIYGWVRSSSPAIRAFMEIQGFEAGHEYTWMEKR